MVIGCKKPFNLLCFATTDCSLLIRLAFCYASILSILMILLSIGHLGYTMSASSSSPPYNTITSFDNMIEESLELIKVIPFNNTNPLSITVDPVSNLLYISVRPDYYSNYLSQSCFGQNTVTSNNVSDSIYSCSVIYVLDGETDQ